MKCTLKEDLELVGFVGSTVIPKRIPFKKGDEFDIEAIKESGLYSFLRRDGNTILVTYDQLKNKFTKEIVIFKDKNED